MSRIDQALKAWEATHGVVSSGTQTTDTVDASFDDYPVEGRNRADDDGIRAAVADPGYVERPAPDSLP